jgi:hypothetical protein
MALCTSAALKALRAMHLEAGWRSVATAAIQVGARGRSSCKATVLREAAPICTNPTEQQVYVPCIVFADMSDKLSYGTLCMRHQQCEAALQGGKSDHTLAACPTACLLQVHAEKQAARAAQTVKDAPQATFSSKSASLSQAKEPSPANYTIMPQQQEIRKDGMQKLFF